MSELTISDNLLHRQKWKLYAAAFLWPLYLLILPFACATIGPWFILLVVFPGVFLWAWMAMFAHECVHKYWPFLRKQRFYRLLCMMIFLDPKEFRRVHAIHHIYVNTYRDSFVYPIGRIENRYWRTVFNYLEVFFGDVFVLLVTLAKPNRKPAKKGRKPIRPDYFPLLTSTAFLLSICLLSQRLLGVGLTELAISHAVSFWIIGVLMRHNMMIQHRNVIAEGDQRQRALLTRNLKPAGVLERAFLFLMHQDYRNHVLHHTSAEVHSRVGHRQLAVPQGAVFITMRDYARILSDMLTGRA